MEIYTFGESGDLQNEKDMEELNQAEKDFEQMVDLPGDDEVLKLTEYDGGSMLPSNNFIAAEYVDINIATVDKTHQKTATSFVNKITKFILDFKDTELTKDHKSYISDVASLQLSNLQDLLSLVTINRSMLDNIVRRVNAVQAEDYSMINAYNNLTNQHLKLLKELQNTYKGIPATLKKMRTEVLCNQELIGEAKPEGGEEVVTAEFGTTQFNNTKQLLKTLRQDNLDKLNKG